MRPYRRWLGDTLGELQDAVLEAENAEWHHSQGGSPEEQLYHRLMTWVAEVDSRIKHYDYTKTRTSKDVR